MSFAVHRVRVLLARLRAIDCAGFFYQPKRFLDLARLSIDRTQMEVTDRRGGMLRLKILLCRTQRLFQ